MYSNTHLFRLQHLAHHQFVNDPDRDPDLFQMRKSGHWLNFPISKQRFATFLLSQFWIPNVLKFVLVRAQFSATGSGDSPYLRPGVVPNYTAVNLGIAMVFGNVALIGLGLYVPMLFQGLDWVRWLALSPAVLAVLAWLIFPNLPANCFTGARLHPPITPAISMAIRISEIMLIWGAFTLWAVLGDWRGPIYYVALWVVPIFTSFSSFMMMRQIVQHGNGGRGWISNTRVFEVNPLLRYAVFPVGMDYHLPHHLFSSVPHYRLHGLHAMLCRYPEYLRHAVEVHGYFVSPEKNKVHPTVVDVLGPEWRPGKQRIYIDNSVLDGVEVDDRDAILAEGKKLSSQTS
jgi:fatty acid desaturase